jgi:PTH1 family peptidyl-tRNA hydrolase
MTLVLGLGNPGSKYDHTRHNAGFDVVSECAAFFQVRLRKRCFRLYRTVRFPVSGQEVVLVEPLTYMNSSGEIAPDFLPVDPASMIVVCDQMDLPVGMVRVRRGGSSAGHNGLKSVISCFGTSDFLRIYIGTGRPGPGESVVSHVLTREASPEWKEGIEKGKDALVDLLQGKTMDEVARAYNRKNTL